jgi:hypothetical protein
MSKNEIPAIREATGAFCRSILEAILPAVREVARFNGYAVTVHGRLKRDIDLVAIAWADQAIPADDIAQAIRGAVAAILGNCIMLGEIKSKPHGPRGLHARASWLRRRNRSEHYTAAGERRAGA